MTMETVNPERSQIVRVTVACGVLATLAVFLRFLARWRSKASFAADDWWMLASLIPSYCMLAVGSISSFDGSSIVPSKADKSSDHEWRRRPAYQYIDSKPDCNVSEGRLVGLHPIR